MLNQDCDLEFWVQMFLQLYGIELAQKNLKENREQTASNDIHVANQIQERHILKYLKMAFDEQNKKIDMILSILEGSD